MTHRVKFHHEDPVNGSTTFKCVGKYEFFNRVDGAGWFVANPADGNWGNGSKVSDDVIFDVVDFNGNHLFAERNGNLGAFRSIGEKARRIASGLSLPVKSLEAWLAWMAEDRIDRRHKGNMKQLDIEPQELISETYILVYMHLGLTFRVVIEEFVSPVTKKQWREVFVKNMTHDRRVLVCGYIFQNETINKKLAA
jgi:hypothetical protein